MEGIERVKQLGIEQSATSADTIEQACQTLDITEKQCTPQEKANLCWQAFRAPSVEA